MFSELIAGTMRWGVWGANHSVKEIQKLIEFCLEENITTFDHADIYGGHTTEELFGNAWKEMDLKRENLQFISKCGIVMNSEKKPSALKYYNYNKDYILNCVDESLSNLKTDYLDVLLLHRPSPLMNPEVIAEAFTILKTAGKVKDFGVSNFSVSQFELINQYVPMVTNQIEISVNEISSFENGVLDQMLSKGLRPTAWSVMGSYFSDQSDENIRIKKVIVELCDKYSAEENQILLAFILKHPSKIIPIIGTSKAETIRTLSKTLQIDLDLEDWFRILESNKGTEVD
ncbi:aldo/keto reductase [Epilithonimonas sp.]|uniref:aldo/keto reductase n=1 Tax=Epilithonimonas sp. TaxID=2894511 RepID=UPI00289D09A6|nr:aldo/keto reductase [Epilithonimonas sp.]